MKITRQQVERAERLLAMQQQATASVRPGQYDGRPVDYCREVLKVDPWQKQCEALESIHQPPYKVLGRSSHSVGKTFVEACLVNYWFDTYNPSCVITTAPTARDVRDLLWAQVRLLRQRAGLGGFAGDKAPELWDGPDHYAKGFTAARGESLDVNTVIDTPSGQRRFGDLAVGDFVFGADGNPTRVVKVHRNGIRPAYRVTFSTGPSVIADGKHIWAVANAGGGCRGKLARLYGRRPAPYQLLTTEEILAQGVTFKAGDGQRAKFHVPENAPVQYPERPVPIPPYTLGAWLGDGTCHNGNITNADNELIAAIRDENIGVLVTDRPLKKNKARAICVRGMRGKLRKMGLLGGKTTDKRLPREYMENSYAVRLAVLQGLMDADGTTGATGASSFVSTSKGLAEDVVWLVRSLGGRACLRPRPKIKKRPEGGTYKPAWMTSVRLDAPLFRITRKQSRRPPSLKPRRPAITSIEPCGDAEMMCITVDAADGLFLANDFVVTHNSFQGRHPERMLILFDEATGIDATFWATARTMFQANGKHAWVCMFNPTDTSSQAHVEEHKVDVDGNPQWRVIQISSLDHPNIHATLDGKPEPYPGAVNLAQFEDWLAAWSDEVDPADHTETDLQWPPEWWRAAHTPDVPPRWWRPGPLMEGRALGRYPSAATFGVWSERAWGLATAVSDRTPDLALLPEIGCDVARQGDDYTAIHVRWGHLSLHHERHNGWEYTQTADRLKQLCEQYAAFINGRRESQRKPVTGEEILVKVDADAYGWGVVEHKDNYNFIGLGASWRALRPSRYPNRRSELWFHTLGLAKAGKLCLARLPQEHQNRLRQQCFAPQWHPQGGLMAVEQKDETKRRLGASPDDADAMNLAYAESASDVTAEAIDTDDVPTRPRFDSRDRDARPGRHGLFGRG